MPRVNRSALPDGAFHVITHAVAGDPLFFHDGDRRLYLALLDIVAARCGWKVLTFVLMDTHVHLLVIAKVSDLSEGLWHLHTRYAIRFRRRHPFRRGHVFERRPRTIPIRDERYLAAVMRYIARNPVAAGMCTRAEDHAWSAHRAILGLAPHLPFIDGARPLARLGRTREGYASLVAGEDPREELELRRLTDWPPADRPTLASLVTATADPTALQTAHRDWGYTIRQIAEAAGVSPATVTRRMKQGAWHLVSPAEM